MPKLGADPVLRQLVHAVNESGQTRVPVTVSAHGTLVTGVLIAQDAYFALLAEGSPMLNALRPASGLLGKEYAKDIDAKSAHHVHIRATGRDEGLWRVRLDAVDGWTVGASLASEDDKGPFARLLGA